MLNFTQEIADETPVASFKGPSAAAGGGGRNSSNEHKLDIGDTVRMQAAVPSAYGGLQDLPSPSGRLSDRIERLRQRCTEALGSHAFRDAYNFLKQHEEVLFAQETVQCSVVQCSCLSSELPITNTVPSPNL